MNRAELVRLAEENRRGQKAVRLLLCYSTPCLVAGAPAIRRTLEEGIAAAGLQAEVAVTATGCMGPCSRGPLLTIQRAGTPDVTCQNVTPELARCIVAHLAGGNPPPKTAILPPEHPFLARQQRWVLENSGRIDPESIEEYIGCGGYAALDRVLGEMTPEAVCMAIDQSGLRGRGGAGYPTGLKWQLMRKAPAERKFVVANGDEGDPGAFMDRTLMESDPHRLLEGMAIAGYAVGASHGYLYVRGEYPVAGRRLEMAVRDAERLGILGTRVLDSNFHFRIDLRMGAGAYVCGEETSLLASIMGHRGNPRPRPPYPAQRGLWGYPTLINNVETLGAIPAIIRRGAGAFAAIGSGKSRGTKVFSLTGEVTDSGAIEVPMGITLREIIEEIGGGMADGQAFKAAQTGGPSGGCIPAQHLDTPVTYEDLAALGSIMGSGGLIVLGEKSCMVDVAKYFMAFCLDESCGKCIPCRAGTVEMYNILNRISNGSAEEAELPLLQELCSLAKEASLCGLGASAPNPVLSTLRYFEDEYLAHIRERRCPAGVCRITEVPRARLGEHLLQQLEAARSETEGF
jgi:bidirectional [NiFe] hydrogenase diaphorase subunit